MFNFARGGFPVNTILQNGFMDTVSQFHLQTELVSPMSCAMSGRCPALLAGLGRRSRLPVENSLGTFQRLVRDLRVLNTKRQILFRVPKVNMLILVELGSVELFVCTGRCLNLSQGPEAKL